MAIADTIASMQTHTQSAYTAIGNKGGTIPAQKNLSNLATAINSISGGGTVTVEEKDVNFYDYDGTLTNSYTKTEFLALSALPANPTHTGLTAQGWNWTLSDAQTYVTTYGKLNIGQMYITDDGKTRIYITLGEGRLSPYLGLGVNGEVDVDWGDGSTHDTLTGTSRGTPVYVQHNYSSAGDYVIKLTVNNGAFSFIKNSNYSAILLCKNTSGSSSENQIYNSAITKILLGNGITTIEERGLNSCNLLEYITMPNTITLLGQYSLYVCRSLKYITVPAGVTSLPANTFGVCTALRNISLPNGITFIGGHAFERCYSLSSITIPNTVTQLIQYAIYGCQTMKYVILPNSITYMGNYILQDDYILKTTTIPNTITSIPALMFSSCYNLKTVDLPNQITTINSNAFNNCWGLENITIPASVVTIAASAFPNCYGLGFIKFEPTTPPTVANANAFTNLPTDCKILVPSGTLSAYTSATNYPSSSTYTYEEY